MVNTQTILLLLVMTALFSGAIIYVLLTQMRKLKTELKSNEGEVLIEWLKQMQSSVDKTTQTLETQLKGQRDTMDEKLKSQRDSIDKQTKMIWERLDNATQVIGTVKEHLTGLRTFEQDMKDLSNILKSPKLRGGLGEQFLYEILAASLPKELYKTQYKFRDGTLCDAIIYTEKGIIPIDSKFPMENFKRLVTCESPLEIDSIKKVFIRDVKKHIDVISSKYILPQESTVDFAVMYIPSENVFYELIVNTQEIEDYARSKNVFLTSPNTLSYQVKAILVAFQQQELNKHAGEILKAISTIKIEAQKFQDDLNVLDGHVDRAYKSVDNVKSRYAKLFGRIESADRISEGENIPILSDTPQA